MLLSGGGVFMKSLTYYRLLFHFNVAVAYPTIDPRHIEVRAKPYPAPLFKLFKFKYM